MKKNILWTAAALLMLAGCLDDENNYDYIHINNYDGYKVKNIKRNYTCFQGEEILLEPEVKFSIDSIHPDISYEWYVDGEIKSKEPTYRFLGEKPSSVDIVFCSIDNKTGVRFPTQTTIKVTSKYLQSWLLLSTPEGIDESQLSAVLMKQEERTRMENGKEVTFDTIIFIGEEKNIVPGLGHGPLKLSENFTFDENGLQSGQLPDEIVVVQRDKTLELNGNTLEVITYAEDEFLGEIPAGFQPTDAAGNYACKYLLNKDGYVYFARNTISIDLNTSRYFNDPAFGGRKVKAITPAHKLEYGHTFGLALDENNTVFGIVNAVTIKTSTDYNNGSMNWVGLPLNVSLDGADSSYFYHIPGEVLFIGCEEYDEYGGGYISLIREGGNYYANLYTLDNYNSTSGSSLTCTYAKKVALNPAMFSNWKEAVIFHHQNYILVANGNELWHYSFDEAGDQGKKIKTFDKPIVSLSSRDFSKKSEFWGKGHAGIALENGEFYIFELSYPDSENVNQVNMRELYHKTGFGDIKDVCYKYGRAYNMKND